MAMNLLKSKCVPILTYALQSTSGCVSELRSLNNMIDMAVARIFNVRDSISISWIRVVFGVPDLTLQFQYGKPTARLMCFFLL